MRAHHRQMLTLTLWVLAAAALVAGLTVLVTCTATEGSALGEAAALRASALPVAGH